MTTTAKNTAHVGLQELEDFSIQQQDSEEYKQILIEATTWKLRQELLEEKYQSFMAQLVELQSRLEIIKLDASISLQLLSTSVYVDQISNGLQYQQLEKRLEGHQQDLSQLVVSFIDSKLETVNILNTPRLKPTVIARATTQSNQTQENSSSLSTYISASDQYRKQGREEEDEGSWYYRLSDHPVRPRRKRKLHHFTKQQSTQSTAYTDICSTPSELSTNSDRKQLVDLEHRNALDETLSFLDQLASDTDDGGFRHDMYCLLRTETIKELEHVIQTDCRFSLIQRILYSSLKWARYTLVLILAIIINLKKGPNMFLETQFCSLDKFY